MVPRGLQQSGVCTVNKNTYMLITALIAIILLLLLSFYPANIKNDKSLKPSTVYQCADYTSGCKASINNKKVEIKFPKDIVFLERFPIEVKLDGIPAAKVTVEFRMVGMDMGLNFYQLQQGNKDKSIWMGEGVLPVCTTGRTDWQSIISIEQEGEIQQVVFQFTVRAKS